MRLVLPLISPVLLQHGGTATVLRIEGFCTAPKSVQCLDPACCPPSRCSGKLHSLLQSGIHIKESLVPMSALMSSTVLNLPLYSLDGRAPLCMQCAVSVKYVQNPCLPICCGVSSVMPFR